MKATVAIDKTNKTATITVSAEAWSTRLRLKSEAAAIAAKIEELDKAIALPTGAELSEALDLVPGEKARAIVVDGNGDERGKGSLFYVAPTEIPKPRWTLRLS